MENLPVTADDLVNAIDKTRHIIKTSGDGFSYLKLSKGGFWVYGQDDMEVEEEAQWAVNPASFMIGYVAWPAEGTGKPLGEEMRRIADDPIAESQLPQVAGNWTQQVGMQLACVSGEDIGTQVLFKASSKGGINGFNDFLNQVMTHLKANLGTDKIVPIILLDVDSYKHEKYGKIYTPIFSIKSWATMDAVTVDEEEEEAPETEPETDQVVEPEVEEKAPPKKKSRRSKADSDEKPTRRRRRRAAA